METIPNTTIQPQAQLQPKKESKWLMWGLIGFTAILLLTAIILFFQLKKPAPEPTIKPKASPQTVPVQQQQTEGVCALSFAVGVSPSPSPSASPVASPSPSPSLEACFNTCDNDSQCMSGLRCMTVSNQKRCVNAACTEETDCSCASPTPSASPTVSASPQAAASPKLIAAASPAPEALPKAGANTPLVLGVSAGILMMLLGLLF